MRGIVLTNLFVLLFIVCYSQEVAVDSKGEPVFQLYAKDDARLQFNRRAVVSGSYLLNVKEKTVDRFSGILVQLSMLNSGDFPMVEKLRNIRPGVGIKIGYQRSIQQLAAINTSNKSSVNCWGVNAFFNLDNIKLYDTTIQIAQKKYPLTYGLEGNYTFFFKNKKGNANFTKALSLYTALSSTWNDHNLLSYQEISKLTFRPDVVAMQNFDGRYGALRSNFFKYRMVVSFPLFYKRLNATPYWAGIFGTQNSPSYHMGVFTNILSSPLNKSTTRMPSNFGIGFDWVYATEHLPASVNLFLKASISLGSLRKLNFE
jgi:hypothetical protein